MELFFLLLLIVIMATALGSGFPVAFALPGSAIITVLLAAGAGWLFGDGTDAFFHSSGPSQWLSAGVTNLRGVYLEVERDTLIAIPLFLFMGIMLQRSKIAEDLLVTMARLFGPVPGGLGISVVFVGALLAATTGIVGATVVAMGLISLPAMLRNNYSQPLAAGTIAASGTLGQIIPPSIVLIILADQLASAADQGNSLRGALYRDATGELSMPSMFDVTSTSAGEMFLGAFVPGIMLVLFYMAFILVYALIRPQSAPAVRYEDGWNARFWGEVALTLIPPLALIILVLGSILTGVATVNQAGSIGAAGALLMAGYRLKDSGRLTYVPVFLSIAGLAIISVAIANYDMNVKGLLASGGEVTGIWLGVLGSALIIGGLVWSGLRVLKIENTRHEVMIETAKTTSMVFIILLGAAMLTAAFRAFGGEDLVREFLLSLPGGFWTQFIIVMAVIFILGFFLDFIEIAVVVVPIVAPILLSDPSANITAVWLGVMIGLNIQTSFLTPPFGFALFYLRGVAPAVVKTVQIYKGVIVFIVLQLVALGVVGYLPKLVNYLPNRSSLLSETAPPPRNPQLQYCLEEYVAHRLEDEPDALTSTIAAMRGLDLGVLPAKYAEGLTASFESVETALATLDDAFTAEADVIAATGAYRPQLRVVRDIQKDMRVIDTKLDQQRRQLSFLRFQDDPDLRATLESRIAELEEERARMEATIPESWTEVNAAFTELVSAENRARNGYRRAGDAAHREVAELIGIMETNATFLALEADLRALERLIAEGELVVAQQAVDDLATAFAALPGANEVRSDLAGAADDLDAQAPDRTAASTQWTAAVAAFETQAAWRRQAMSDLEPDLAAYFAILSDTVGSRQQARLSRDQALFIAACNAGHRDISIHF
ncbi:TRAP transporter large permease subunit [Marinovum algicola]|uniref:TRAP transporter large permease subunit n=1 Tax=Marinovum algicola TaxID=42444 RepID=UPI0024BB04C7|nr:TRAP transporter large permease subunit [Marinovum algicola]